ncbi:hypothetical protein L208DRAFT_948284 [Tricholoma matsutake]|nr:hypothetical protein L208DRAFT_948284 [Tricholoma matsutake 945]
MIDTLTSRFDREEGGCQGHHWVWVWLTSVCHYSCRLEPRNKTNDATGNPPPPCQNRM